MPVSSHSLGAKSPGAARGLESGGREKICAHPFASGPHYKVYGVCLLTIAMREMQGTQEEM